jgi:hypothetical protein
MDRPLVAIPPRGRALLCATAGRADKGYGRLDAREAARYRCLGSLGRHPRPFRLFGRGAQRGQFGFEGGSARLHEHTAVGEEDGRHTLHAVVQLSDQCGAIWMILDVHLRVRHAECYEDAPRAVAVTTPGRRVHQDLAAWRGALDLIGRRETIRHRVYGPPVAGSEMCVLNEKACMAKLITSRNAPTAKSMKHKRRRGQVGPVWDDPAAGLHRGAPTSTLVGTSLPWPWRGAARYDHNPRAIGGRSATPGAPVVRVIPSRVALFRPQV